VKCKGRGPDRKPRGRRYAEFVGAWLTRAQLDGLNRILSDRENVRMSDVLREAVDTYLKEKGGS
jgi:hypothetical protein